MQNSTVVLSLYFLLFIFLVGCSPIVLKLEHHDSPNSPLYIGNLTMWERSYIDLEMSIKRASYLTGANTTTNNESLMETNLVVQDPDFVAYLQFGSRLTDQYVYMDTGSAFLWINCASSSGGMDAQLPLFESRRSSSFRGEYCNTATNICHQTASVHVYCYDAGTPCAFSVEYVSGQKVTGVLGRDAIKFGNDIVRDVLFGCTTKSTFTNDFNGLLGLRPEPISLLGQINAKLFAYCIGSLTEKIQSSTHKLLIGDDVELLGATTSLFTDPYYTVSLEQIRVGGKKLNINPKLLRRHHEDKAGGVLVDTGSTYSFFPRVALEKFEEAISDALSSLEKIRGLTYGGVEQKCFEGVIRRDLKDFPTVEFVFENFERIQLKPRNLFKQFVTQMFCLAEDFIHGGQSLLGVLMQQNYYIAYETELGIISFQMMDDCADLDY